MTARRSARVGTVAVGLVVALASAGGLPAFLSCAHCQASRTALVARRASVPGQLGAQITPEFLPYDKKSEATAVARPADKLESRVAFLQRSSEEACLLADEDHPEWAESCAILSYELSTAEQVLSMRADSMRHEWTDADSY